MDLSIWPRGLLAPLLIGTLLVTGGCGAPATDLPTLPSQTPLRVDTIARGLDVPWDLAFAPDGRIFFTERPGRIRVIEDGVLQPEPWAVLDVAQRSETGLMGIAVAPDFETSRELYVVGAFDLEDGTEDQVVRYVERDGRGADRALLLGGIPAARFHAGAALDFGPDGLLYISAGDATRPGTSQDMGSLGGKILRISRDGSIPADNPFPGSPIYALGVRNIQGLDWHPDTGELFTSGHGPTRLPQERFRSGGDEVNVIEAGGNYGWPAVAGNQGGDEFPLPIVAWTPAIAPGGAAFYRGDFGAWRGNLFVSGLRSESLIRIELTPYAEADSRWRARGAEALFEGEYGRIRAVVSAPNGDLYFTTSNRDGRGDPRVADDMILRIVVP